MASPSNNPFLNPEVIECALQTRGQCSVDGAANFIDDFQRLIAGRPPAGTDDYIVGKDVAATVGTVVFRSALFELIQYAPATKAVHPEPILITPAWIMK